MHVKSPESRFSRPAAMQISGTIITLNEEDHIEQTDRPRIAVPFFS
jgi:hypothetical protein